MRLCTARGMDAIFHKWCEVAEVIPPSMARGGHQGGQIKYTTALVEFKTGQVTEVMASDVVFKENSLTVDEIAELSKAKDEGRLVILPCKPSGADLYFIDKFNKEIYKEAYTGGICLAWTNDSDIGDSIPLSVIGRTVFLSREEAEKALEEVANG